MKKEIMEDVNLIIQSIEDVLFLVVVAAATILIHKNGNGRISRTRDVDDVVGSRKQRHNKTIIIIIMNDATQEQKRRIKKCRRRCECMMRKKFQ
jgi:hypothetical protein